MTTTKIYFHGKNPLLGRFYLENPLWVGIWLQKDSVAAWTHKGRILPILLLKYYRATWLAVAKFGMKIMIFSVYRIIACGAALLFISCKQNPYTVTFNNNVVYSPNAAIRNKVLDDPALQACLNQVMTSSTIEDPEEVTLIACPSAGITTLGGIEKLSNLEQLDVSDNSVSNISPLLSLKKLRVLSLRNNALSTVSPLANMPLLRFISLSGNTRISCRDVQVLENKLGNTLDKPLTCVE